MKSTYSALGFSQVPDAYKQCVREELKKAIENNELVCVILNDFYYEDDSYDTHLYGVYRESHDWVSNYDSSGGMWHYDHPNKFLEN